MQKRDKSCLKAAFLVVPDIADDSKTTVFCDDAYAHTRGLKEI